MTHRHRKLLQAHCSQSVRGESDGFRVSADTRWPDQFRAKHRELARMTALRRLIAEDRPRKLPADRLDGVLIAFNIESSRRGGELRAQAKLSPIHLEVE